MAISAYRRHTIAETFEQICNRQTPWVAIGNFLNDWWYYSIEHRRELIETPPIPAPDLDMQRWAAFCAAMVEWLCQEANLPVPSWTNQEYYFLPAPWFYYPDLDSRSWLLTTTPAPFKMRNIFIGDRAFLHKVRVS